jgi:hypothetical protein
MSRKVFTAGEVLAAADVNSFLMDQTVMSFAGTAARGSAIPSPVEGMYTHLEDSDRLEFWNGSAWRSPAGLTLVNSTSFTAQSQVDVSNIFSSEFENYKIVIVAGLTASATSGLFLRMLSSGTPSTASYEMNRVAYNLGTASIQQTLRETTSFNIGWLPFSNAHISTLEISRPFESARSGLTGMYAGDATGAYASAGMFFGYHQVTASYDGVRIYTSGGGIMTGTIRTYGYRNA